MTEEERQDELIRLLPHSVTLRRNAKNEMAWDIKIRFPEGTTVEEMTLAVTMVNDELMKQFGK